MATIALHPDAASGETTDRSGPPPGAVVDIDKYKYKYLVAIAVSLAAMLELIDTSIVNVAIPHMMGISARRSTRSRGCRPATSSRTSS